MKTVQLSHLIEVLQSVCQLSFITRSERSSAWDFDRSAPFLEEHALHKHLNFVSGASRHLPLNSERRPFGMNNIIIQKLHIDLDDRSGWTTHRDWKPLSFAKWHFVNCHFESSSPNMWSMHFPWRGSFRFYRNKFDLRKSRRFGGHWIFSFQNGSRVWFHGNDFKGNHIQTSCITPAIDRNESDEPLSDACGSGSISFIANKQIGELDFQEGYSSVALTGINRIDRLSITTLPDADQGRKTTVLHLGPREQIDRAWHYSLHHRDLFLSMRHLAAMNHDTRQVNILDKQLDRIEYFLNKELGHRSSIEYWQDRLLYAWRRWSSSFYTSWLRPLSMMILGYILLNAIPAVFIETFSLSHFIDFTLRPINEVAAYEGTLNMLVGSDYDKLSLVQKSVLRLSGLVEIIWIGMCGFAFSRTIKRSP